MATDRIKGMLVISTSKFLFYVEVIWTSYFSSLEAMQDEIPIGGVL